MLEVFVKYICFIMMTLTGAFVIKKIINDKIRILTIKNILKMSIPLLIPTLLHNSEYSSINTFIILFININVYKSIFKKSITETILLSCSVMIISFIADLLNWCLLYFFTEVSAMREIWYVMLISNITSCLFSLLLISPKIISQGFNKATNKIHNNKYFSEILFFFLIFMVFCIFAKVL